jgi:hypothetical protein
MEVFSSISGMALFLALCLDFPRLIVQSFFIQIFREKFFSHFLLELNPNQN